MGRLRTRLRPPLAAILLCGTLLSGQSSTEPPPDLPEPPPLPPEMLERRPMEPPPDLPDPSELIDQLKQLEDLLSMSPEQLGKLRQTIEFIEKMSAEEREAMRIRLSQVTRMTSERRREIERLHALAPSVSESELTQFWLAASEEERAAMQDALSKLDREAREGLITRRVENFVRKRDEAFARMRESLEAKRKASRNPED